MAGSTERYGALGRFWLSFIPFFVVLRPDDIQTILSSKVHIDKSPFYNIMHSYMGDSIVLANGESWHNKRKLLNPFFHISVMEKLFGIMSEGGQQLCNLLATKDEGINITSYLNNCVDQILNCECVCLIRPIRRLLNGPLNRPRRCYFGRTPPGRLFKGG